MPRIRACRADELSDGESRTIEGSPPVAVFRVGGEFYATDDRCTHEDWSLGEDGSLDGHEVECCLHLARFDVRTGAATQLPATEPLAVYPVTVTDGEVWLDLP